MKAVVSPSSSFRTSASPKSKSRQNIDSAGGKRFQETKSRNNDNNNIEDDYDDHDDNNNNDNRNKRNGNYPLPMARLEDTAVKRSESSKVPTKLAGSISIDMEGRVCRLLAEKRDELAENERRKENKYKSSGNIVTDCRETNKSDARIVILDGNVTKDSNDIDVMKRQERLAIRGDGEMANGNWKRKVKGTEMVSHSNWSTSHSDSQINFSRSLSLTLSDKLQTERESEGATSFEIGTKVKNERIQELKDNQDFDEESTYMDNDDDHDGNVIQPRRSVKRISKFDNHSNRSEFSKSTSLASCNLTNASDERDAKTDTLRYNYIGAQQLRQLTRAECAGKCPVWSVHSDNRDSERERGLELNEKDKEKRLEIISTTTSGSISISRVKLEPSVDSGRSRLISNKEESDYEDDQGEIIEGPISQFDFSRRDNGCDKLSATPVGSATIENRLSDAYIHREETSTTRRRRNKFDNEKDANFVDVGSLDNFSDIAIHELSRKRESLSFSKNQNKTTKMSDKMGRLSNELLNGEKSVSHIATREDRASKSINKTDMISSSKDQFSKRARNSSSNLVGYKPLAAATTTTNRIGSLGAPLARCYQFGQSYPSSLATTRTTTAMATTSMGPNLRQSIKATQSNQSQSFSSMTDIEYPITSSYGRVHGSSINPHHQNNSSLPSFYLAPSAMSVTQPFKGNQNAPKRLIYFYDLNDDIDDEIEFLSKSLESKSYAISMQRQNDPYLDSISRSVASSGKIELSNAGRLHERYRKILIQNSILNNHHHHADKCQKNRPSGFCKHDNIDQTMTGESKISRLVDSINLESNMASIDNNYEPYLRGSISQGGTFSASKRGSKLSGTGHNYNITGSYQKSRESSIMSGGSIHLDSSFGNQTTALQNNGSFLSGLGPHWCSLPSHLNQISLTMMRYYQLSLNQNFHYGRRERAMICERAPFDRSCCRVDTEAYDRALDLWKSLVTATMDSPLLSKKGSGSGELNVESQQQQQQTRRSSKFPSLSMNLGVIYEPFESSLANKANPPTVDSSSPSDSKRSVVSTAIERQPLKGSKLHQELLKSIQNYATAMRAYRERQQNETQIERLPTQPIHHSRTSQALRRGSAIVLSKLKIMQSQQDHPSDTNISALAKQEALNSTNAVPRLSLTRAESLAIETGNQQPCSSLGSINLAQRATIQSDNITRALSLGRQGIISGELHDLTLNDSSASSADLVGMSEKRRRLVQKCLNSPDLDGKQQKNCLTGSPCSNRHSIGYFPTPDQGDLASSSTTSVRPTSCTEVQCSTNRRLNERTGLIHWLGSTWNRSSLSRQSNQSNQEHQCEALKLMAQRDSVQSQLSGPTWIDCQSTDPLGLNWRRRRSFSGPFEWFWRETRPYGQDLSINMTSRKKLKGSKGKKQRKIKTQRSNSSDYHSLNNRKVYRLISRGFQTKLQGIYYVIRHDPLMLRLSPIGLRPQDVRNIRNYDIDSSQNLDFQLEQANEFESSLVNTSGEDGITNNNNNNNNSAIVIMNGNKTVGGEVGQLNDRGSSKRSFKGIKKDQTFLIYFKWNKWMLKRRHYSLFLFSPRSRVRRFCLSVISRKEFDYFVLFFISMNCITLAMERPIIPPNSKEREFLNVANYYFTFMFTLEMALKVIAKGLYYGHGAYLSDNWNIMDGALVGLSLFDLMLSIVADRSPRIFGILRVFRLLRSLRPLRVINRLMGLKLVVQTLLLSLRPIGNIVLICCTFFIIFGILGVQLFKGTFYYCDGPDPLEIMRTVKTKEDCIMDHRNRWVNRKYNFDNLGQALMALFVLSSKDGWVNIMYTGLDAVGVDIQPRENYNEWRLLYFISFLLLVAFFVLNMFVGVVVENFHRCRKEQELEEKARRAEKRQRKLDKRRRKLREPPYYSNYGRFRTLLHKWVTGGYFDLLIAAVIGFNVIFMSLEHYQMPPELIHLLKVSNYVFTAAFILEAVIKSTALGMRRYLKDRWNQLDVMIVALSVVGIVFEELESFTFPINPTLLRVLRVMRIARVLKLLKMAKGIRALLDTVMQALPQVGNLGLLFFLLFFIFAALGVELFGRLECSDEYPCSGLMDQHAHFQNFGLAFLTLFRVATGDNWNGIMKDTLRDKCDPSSNCTRNCCVSQIIAPLYFVVFVLLAQFVLVNVVVAVLMKHLEESHHEMEIDEEYELDKQLAEELAAKRRALMEARERQYLYWI